MIIVKTIYGSHLYGTNIETSDKDIKQIHKDSLENIILKRSMDNITSSTNAKFRNTSDDVDFESKELRIFISQCLEGQTYAHDILFTPQDKILESSSIWNDIQKYKHKLVCKNIKPYVGYSEGMCRKYSDKGKKLQELIDLRDILQTKDISGTLGEALENVEFNFIHIKKYNKFNSSSKVYDAMLEVADADYPLHRKLSEVMKSVNDKIDNYGKRAQLARVSNGSDTKAFYHALRVCWQLEELLYYGFITFPSKRVSELRDIRENKYSREYIEKWLTDEIQRVLTLPNNLPEPDKDFWDEWILQTYLGDE